MKTWVAVSLIGAMGFSSAAQAQASAADSSAATMVGDVTVVGRRLSDATVIGGKIAPTTEDPKSATCEFLVATDSFVRAQLSVAANGGDPFYMMDLPGMPNPPVPKSNASSLLGPTIYLPTRLALNVDFQSPPLTPPGSALPEIPRQVLGVSARSVNSADGSVGPDRRLYNIDAPPMGTPGEFTIQQALDACRGFNGSGGPETEIAYRDRFLPMATALFKQRRYAESLDYYRQAFNKLSYANGGDEAALMIGKLHLGAPGIMPDARQALIWLERAAGAKFNRLTSLPRFDPREPERNTAMGEAAMILGSLYRTGASGVARNPAAARKWFERALYVGHVRAALVLGDIYYYGEGAPRDLKQAFIYYKEGATLGDAPAQQALAEMYYAGEAPEGRDLKLAAAWHSQAARIGHAPSLYALGAAYENGDGVVADPQRALALYKLAAMNGSAAALNAVGTYVYDGRGLEKDPTMARRWFEQAAVAGDPDAMYNLGAMMMKGEGGEVDRTRAWVWLKIAERGENPNAPAAVAVLEARMTAQERAEAARLLAPKNS